MRIAATLPLGSASYEAEANERGERYVRLVPAVADRLGAMRGPGESFSDEILRWRRRAVEALLRGSRALRLAERLNGRRPPRQAMVAALGG